MMKALCFGVMAVLALAAPVAAQTTVPEPRKTIILDDPIGAVASLGSEWLMVYGTGAPAPLPGQPYLAAVKLTLTPTSGTGTRIVTVPRAQVTRETAAALCPGGSAPCLRIPDVPLPVGSFNMRASYVTGADAEGPASSPIPFSGSFPLPSAPGLRPIP